VSSRRRITAGELLAELEQDPEFVGREQQRERFRSGARQARREAAAPVVTELRLAGFPVQTISDLWNTPLDYRLAIPILLKWLPRIEHDGIKEDIVRGLSVKWARAQATGPLIEEFRRAMPGTTLQWAIGNALDAVADESAFDDVVELVRDRRNGSARQMLVLAVGHMRRAEAATVLLELLSDPDVTGQALVALGNQRASSAQPFIEPYLTHPKAWIRKEARRALAKIARASDSRLAKNRTTCDRDCVNNLDNYRVK
jgi:hypothetical protein